ncbi:hypothetical protein ACOMHN_044382 [Nucella lapillus]
MEMMIKTMTMMMVMMMMMMTYNACGAPCCGPKQWAGEIRRVTMDTRLSDTDGVQGMHYVTPDEVTCTASRLNGSMPQLCVPPSGEPSSPESYRLLPKKPDRYSRSGDSTSGDDSSFGVYAETIYYETDDVIGYVTVTSMTCSFLNEMTYATEDDGGLVWQHTQWNNVTLTVDPESFHMPKSCFNTTLNTQTRLERHQVLNSPPTPPTIAKGEDTPSDSKGEETPRVSKGEETPRVSKEKETPSVSKGEETPSVSKGEETPRFSKGEETPSVSKGDKTP